jgi:GAF domain-containing protein
MPGSQDPLHLMQLENARLKDENHVLQSELFHLRQTIRALNELHQRLDFITPQVNIIALLKDILFFTLQTVDARDGSLQLLDEETGELVFVEVQGPSRDALIGYRLPPGEGIAGWVTARGVPKLVPDVYQEPLFSPLVDQAIGFHTTSLICVPLIDLKRILGVIEVVNPNGNEPFNEKDLDVLLLVARLATIALLRAEGTRR